MPQNDTNLSVHLSIAIVKMLHEMDEHSATYAEAKTIASRAINEPAHASLLLEKIREWRAGAKTKALSKALSETANLFEAHLRALGINVPKPRKEKRQEENYSPPIVPM